MSNPFYLAFCFFMILVFGPPYLYHAYHVWIGDNRQGNALIAIASSAFLSLAVAGIIVFFTGHSHVNT